MSGDKAKLSYNSEQDVDYDVFIRNESDEKLKRVGRVSAPNARLAKVRASKMYGGQKQIGGASGGPIDLTIYPMDSAIDVLGRREYDD